MLDKHFVIVGSGFGGLAMAIRLKAHGASVTLVERPSNLGQNEEGGLSGLPLFQKSLETLKLFRSNLHPNCPIVGVGGISNEEKAKSFLNNGAHLIQVYTGFVYKGTKMVHNLSRI